jgi:predicted acetyltransferase
MMQTEAVVLEPLTRDSEPVLNNLFELYAYDFSEHVPLPLKASGRFEVTPGDAWWTRDDHFGYLIEVAGELAGFALVRAGSRVTNEPDVMDVAEFFVRRGMRSRGVGTSAAHALFRAFPRTWEVRVRRTNVGALAFWSRAVAQWVGGPVSSQPFRSEGVDWDVLRFESSTTSPAPG